VSYLKKVSIFILVLIHFQVVGQELSFIENKGQWPWKVQFALSTETGKSFFESNGITHHFIDASSIAKAHRGEASDKEIQGHVFKTAFIAANTVRPKGENRLPTIYNYFLGNDATKWGRACQSYAGYWYDNLYQGVDLHVYQNNGFAKMDWVVQPHASPSSIQWKYEGTDEVNIENGRLVIRTALGELIEQAPIAYFLIPWEGEASGSNEPLRVRVPCSFKEVNGVFSFQVGEYNKKYALVIDPELIFSSYSGSYDDNFGYTATYDSYGNLISGSSAFGQGYPTTLGAYQTTWGGGTGQGNLAGTDMALSKYDASGTFMQWSTFLGGDHDDLPHSIICNENDELLVFGTTSSLNYPVTTGAFDTSFNGGVAFSPFGVGTLYSNGSDIVVSKLSVNGDQLAASTFIGGSANDGVNTAVGLKFNYADEFRGEIDLDAQGNVYVISSTQSSDFPIVGAAQPMNNGLQEACIFKMDENLSLLLFSTFLGGSDDDSGLSISFDHVGNVLVCGGTQSTDLTWIGAPYQSAYAGGNADGWIAKLAPTGAQVLSLTYFGTAAYDQLYFIETDDQDDVFVYGQTRDATNSLIINAAFSQPNSGMLVTKFNSTLSAITWSTLFGTGDGKPTLSPTAFLVDVCGKIYLSGWGGNVNLYSTNEAGFTNGLLVTPDAFQSTTDGSDFYLLVLEADASAVTYASFFGGNVSSEHVDGGTSRFDRKGIIYQSVCAGCGGNSDFPIYPANAVSALNNNSCNNGVFKYDFQLPLTVADFQLPPQVCMGSSEILLSTSSLATSLEWLVNGVSIGTGNNLNYAFNTSGDVAVTLVASNPNTCNFTDTITRTIEVIEPLVQQLSDLTSCSGIPVQMGEGLIFDPNATYTWLPNDGSVQSPNSPFPLFIGSASNAYTLLINHGLCTDTITQNILVPNLSLTVSSDTTLCNPGVVDLMANGNPTSGNIIWSTSFNFMNPINVGGESTISVMVNGTQTYYAQLTSQGCSVADSVQVNLVANQTEIQGDFTACAGDTLNLFVLNPNPLFSYTWSSTATIASGQGTSSIELILAAPTVVQVTAQTPFGCTATDAVNVNVSNLTSQSVNASASSELVLSGSQVQLFAQPTGLAYQWSPGNLLSNATLANPTSILEETTTFYLTVIDGECIQTDSVTVRVTDFICGNPTVFVPNAFTPNEDNANEWLFVRGNFITEMDFYVFDRWGEMVFESHELSNGWNGYFQGKPVDPAVFAYYLRVVCEGGEVYFEEGNITVLE